MITGSVELTGGVDGALVLKRRRGRAEAFMHVDGRDIDQPTELALKFDQNTATWAIIGDAEEYRLSEGRRQIQAVLADADEPLGPKDITAILADRLGANAPSYGAVREMLSQMVKDGQAQNLGRGQYVHPDFSQRHPDNADILTRRKTDVSLSGPSGHSRNGHGARGGQRSSGYPDGRLSGEEAKVRGARSACTAWGGLAHLPGSLAWQERAMRSAKNALIPSCTGNKQEGGAVGHYQRA